MRVGAAWDDPERCKTAVLAGARHARAQFRVRVGTWNVEWFPDAKPGFGAAAFGTDVPWLACAMAWLDVDVMALQEVKLTARGKEQLDLLTATLSSLTGARWLWVADACEDPTRQHTALVYRTDRVSLSDIATHAEIDPTLKKGGAPECPGWLRPALGAYVTSAAGGLDFHLVTLHLDAGARQRDLATRQQAWKRLAAVRAERERLRADQDLVVAGDFNSVGCVECGVDDAVAETRLLAEALAQSKLRLAAPSQPCSSYFQGAPSLTDHIALDMAMTEASAGSAEVLGVCAAARCDVVVEERLPALRRLSDHCPVIIDLADRDADAETSGR
ncbi:MAG: endonuclease/exonuclease/phosphatase family protein [Deltaproteobacteria bacterium]|nr:endonuclease/exonuclease/phosphatase family protein [Deltaproteobacteria bacterium]